MNDEAVKHIQSASVSQRKEPLASISLHATHTPPSPHWLRSLHASSVTQCTVGWHGDEQVLLFHLLDNVIEHRNQVLYFDHVLWLHQCSSSPSQWLCSSTTASPWLWSTTSSSASTWQQFPKFQPTCQTHQPPNWLRGSDAMQITSHSCHPNIATIFEGGCIPAEWQGPSMVRHGANVLGHSLGNRARKPFRVALVKQTLTVDLSYNHTTPSTHHLQTAYLDFVTVTWHCFRYPNVWI